MNGTLIYQVKNVPKIGSKVIIVVDGKNFPSGTWCGVLEKMDLSTACVVEHSAIRITAVGPCTVKLQDTGTDWDGKEPVGTYVVYPYAAGMDVLIAQINTQKAEVKALKQKLEEKEQTARDVLWGLFNLAGVRKSTINAGLADFGSIYNLVTKK